jgi:hypothetical protein
MQKLKLWVQKLNGQKQNNSKLAFQPIGNVTKSKITTPTTMTESENATFQHPEFSMNSHGKLCCKATGKLLYENEIASNEDKVVSVIVRYVQDTMKKELGFQEVYLPSTSPSQPKCSIFVSSNYQTARKLLMFVAVSRGLSPGIWSRGLVLTSGAIDGSMLSYFRKALSEGYGIIVPNPNKNDVKLKNSNNMTPIPGSATPEEHMDSVWDAFVTPAEAQRVYFIGYSYGGVLIKYLLQSRGEELFRRNGAVALIESSHRIEDGDSATVKSLLAHRAMYWEVNHDGVLKQNIIEGDSPHRTGCTCLSAGKPPRGVSNHYLMAAFCIKNVEDALFRFLNIR